MKEAEAILFLLRDCESVYKFRPHVIEVKRWEYLRKYENSLQVLTRGLYHISVESKIRLALMKLDSL